MRGIAAIEVLRVVPKSVGSISKAGGALESGTKSCWFGNTIRNRRDRIDLRASILLPARLLDKPGLMLQAASKNDECADTYHTSYL